MSSAHHFQSVPVDDYLDGERLVNRKHEYVEGFVYAMAGASNAHNRIATNATGSLYSQLRGKDCQVFNSDTKIRIRFSQGTRFYYPDASVVCLPNASDESFQDAPVIILEVISASTRRTAPTASGSRAASHRPRASPPAAARPRSGAPARRCPRGARRRSCARVVCARLVARRE